MLKAFLCSRTWEYYVWNEAIFPLIHFFNCFSITRINEQPSKRKSKNSSVIMKRIHRKYSNRFCCKKRTSFHFDFLEEKRIFVFKNILLRVNKELDFFILMFILLEFQKKILQHRNKKVHASLFNEMYKIVDCVPFCWTFLKASSSSNYYHNSRFATWNVNWIRLLISVPDWKVFFC